MGNIVSQSDCGVGTDLICTGADTRCQGDTGAPLLSGDNTLVGTITGAAGCSSNSNYGIFNNMPKYTNWIKTTISSESSDSICINRQPRIFIRLTIQNKLC